MDQFNALLNAVGVKWAVVLVTLYWLGTRVAPWFRPHADDLLDIFKRRLAKDLHVERAFPVNQSLTAKDSAKLVEISRAAGEVT
ncbi:MAG: hypothetical protein KGL39_34810 [Patescibacteria group bacterium]|nr:hypothetical protein [Patescibacteria group bacterium]